VYFSTLCQPEDTSTRAQHRVSGGGRLRFWSPKKTALPPVFILLNGATMKLPLCLDSGKNRRRTTLGPVWRWHLPTRVNEQIGESSTDITTAPSSRFESLRYTLRYLLLLFVPRVRYLKRVLTWLLPPAPCSFPLSSQTVGPLSGETLIRLAQGNHGTPDTSVCGLRYLAQLWPEIPRPRPSQTLADSVTPPAWCPLSPTMFPMSSASQAAR
ncbi:hypothetical protein CMEL01_16314, partial [Colletotrichum melonis]